jgi:hypothetical protein
MTPVTTWVLGTLTMTRSTPEAVHSLRDDTLVTYTADGKETTVLSGPGEYQRVAAEVFGLPNLPIADALAVRAEFAARAKDAR